MNNLIKTHWYLVLIVNVATGQAAQHVDFQTQNPEIKTAKFITSYNSLNQKSKN